MKLISHRGNLSGAEPNNENKPSFIDKALGATYDVEVDVWFIDGKWFLGHDAPQYEVANLSFGSRRERIWAHAKNLAALYELSKTPEAGPFYWHQDDFHTLTSNGFIWSYPGQELTPKSIWVCPERTHDIKKIATNPACAGICSDYILYFE